MHGYRPEIPRKQENRRLLMEVKISRQKSRENYGSSRIHVELNKNGHFCSKHRVARLMSENGTVSKHKRKLKITTNSPHSFPIAKNLLKMKTSYTDIILNK